MVAESKNGRLIFAAGQLTLQVSPLLGEFAWGGMMAGSLIEGYGAYDVALSHGFSHRQAEEMGAAAAASGVLQYFAGKIDDSTLEQFAKACSQTFGLDANSSAQLLATMQAQVATYDQAQDDQADDPGEDVGYPNPFAAPNGVTPSQAPENLHHFASNVAPGAKNPGQAARSDLRNIESDVDSRISDFDSAVSSLMGNPPQKTGEPESSKPAADQPRAALDMLDPYYERLFADMDIRAPYHDSPHWVAPAGSDPMQVNDPSIAVAERLFQAELMAAPIPPAHGAKAAIAADQPGLPPGSIPQTVATGMGRDDIQTAATRHRPAPPPSGRHAPTGHRNDPIFVYTNSNQVTHQVEIGLHRSGAPSSTGDLNQGIQASPKIRVSHCQSQPPYPKSQKFFGSFFQKRTASAFRLLCFALLHCPGLLRLRMPFSRQLRSLLLPAILPLLSGCSTVGYRLFHPYGLVARDEMHFTLIDVGVMLLIILPVTVMIAIFVWRYRKSRNAAYDPSWSHSMGLELAMWGIPFLTVIFLGYESYRSTLQVNPYDPGILNYNNPANPPLQVDVVTTDWQWVFIYPQYGIATVDDLVVPAGRPVKLWLTSTSVTNDFFIPEIAPMIDVMPGMRTMDGFQVDAPGRFEGYSADFSGAGFSWMQFSTRILAKPDFDKWVGATQASANALNYAAFTKLAAPTVNVGAKPEYFSHVDSDLFMHVYNDARAGKVYAIPEQLNVITSSVDYTQGKNGTN